MSENDLARSKTLKSFLKEEFNTENIKEVDYAQLKEKVEGPKINKRSEHRKAFNNMLTGKN